MPNLPEMRDRKAVVVCARADTQSALKRPLRVYTAHDSVRFRCECAVPRRRWFSVGTSVTYCPILSFYCQKNRHSRVMQSFFPSYNTKKALRIAAAKPPATMSSSTTPYGEFHLSILAIPSGFQISKIRNSARAPRE